MCGIAGIFSFAAGPLAPACLAPAMARMASRGPDGDGLWHSPDETVLFGHRRLSIIDLSDRASQPMADETGRYIIVFNGEIYNYQLLGKELRARGVRLRTTSDTEVILRLFMLDGPRMVRRLRGMFAFAIWDQQERKMVLARDPYGIKPLYYSGVEGRFHFASQVRALIACGVSTEIDPAGVVGFYLWGNVPEPFTYLRHVRQLPAGTVMTVDTDGRVTTNRYANLADAFDAPVPPHTVHEEIREALLDTVRHHLVADVPVGLFLSAGVDSGALLALMHELGTAPVRSITLAFDEFTGTRDDESVLAAEVAARYGADHATRVVTEEEFRDDIPHVLDAMDQPTIDGLNTYFVSKAARERGLKVAMSGAGGDELFGGYATFAAIPRHARILAPFARLGLSRQPDGPAAMLKPGLLGRSRRLDPKVSEILRYGGALPGAFLIHRCMMTPAELTRVLDPDLAREGLGKLDLLASLEARMPQKNRSPFAAVATLESSIYLRNQLLRDADWASMAHSLEVRVPLVDATLLTRLAPLLAARRRIDKTPLANSPARPLPAPILNKRKTGFSTPIAKWLTRDERLKDWTANPALAEPGTKWAKRWAYVVARHFGLH